MLAKPLTFLLILVTTLLSTTLARPIPTPTAKAEDVSQSPQRIKSRQSRVNFYILTGLWRANKLKPWTPRRNRVRRSRHRTENSHGIVACDFTIDWFVTYREMRYESRIKFMANIREPRLWRIGVDNEESLMIACVCWHGYDGNTSMDVCGGITWVTQASNWQI